MRKEYIGKKFNKLTILSVYEKGKYLFADCLCECGKEKATYFYEVKGGRIKSCGCQYLISNDKWTDKLKQKASELKKGKSHSDEHKAKIAISNTGKKKTDETKRKITETLLKNRGISQDSINEIISLRNQSKTYKEIATITGISKPTILKYYKLSLKVIK